MCHGGHGQRGSRCETPTTDGLYMNTLSIIHADIQ